MTPPTPTSKPFDCVAFKRAAQRRIHARIDGLTPQQEIESFDRAVRSGPLAEFWHDLEQARSSSPPSRTDSKR